MVPNELFATRRNAWRGATPVPKNAPKKSTLWQGICNTINVLDTLGEVWIVTSRVDMADTVLHDLYNQAKNRKS